LEQDLNTLLAFLACPKGHRKAVRTTNPIERAFREVRWRTKVMDNVLPNEAAVLRIFAAVAQDMNRIWRGAALQPISTTSGA